MCRREKDGKVGRLGEELSARDENGGQLPRRTRGFVLNTPLTHLGTPENKGPHETLRFRANVQQAESGSWVRRT